MIGGHESVFIKDRNDHTYNSNGSVFIVIYMYSVYRFFRVIRDKSKYTRSINSFDFYELHKKVKAKDKRH